MAEESHAYTNTHNYIGGARGRWWDRNSTTEKRAICAWSAVAMHEKSLAQPQKFNDRCHTRVLRRCAGERELAVEMLESVANASISTSENPEAPIL